MKVTLRQLGYLAAFAETHHFGRAAERAGISQPALSTQLRELEGQLGGPLQRITTVASTYLLQTCDVPATATGNVIWLTEGRIGVVEACNGLRMLIAFFAVTIGAALVMRGSLREKAMIVLSAHRKATAGCNSRANAG